MTNVLFRADGNSAIGMGHVTRCLALVEILRDEFECIFYIMQPSANVRKLIEASGTSVIELPVFQNIKEEAKCFVQHLRGDEIVVLDGYRFDKEYQMQIREKGSKLVYIDDFANQHQVADVVINHAGGVEYDDYKIEPYTTLCLGPEYALLRKPFLENAGQTRRIDKIENIFICFGGSDIYNLTLKVIKACIEKSVFKHIHVILGPVNKNKAAIERLSIQNHSSTNIELHENLSAQSLLQIMLACQIGITSASTVAYECCCVGMSLICVAYADNQKKLAAFLERKKCAFMVNDYMLLDKFLKYYLSQASINEIANQMKNQKSIFPRSYDHIMQIFHSLLKNKNRVHAK